MKKFTILSLILLISFSQFACASFQNSVEKRGGLVGSYKASWVVINYSGGRIMDVWKLSDAYVESEQGSDGWLFVDSTGNAVHVGGDTKCIRFNKLTAEWEKYHDYHAEFESIPYEQKYPNK